MNIVDRLGTANKGPRLGGMKPSMIVIHGDAGQTEAGTISWILNPTSQVSYHYLIGRDGAVYRLVDESERAWHAGRSEWPGMTDSKNSVNSSSIGVCLANSGTEQYRDAQYDAAAELVADIMRRHAIGVELVRGHNEVSPGRKIDPFPQFNWSRFLGAIAMHLTGRASG